MVVAVVVVVAAAAVSWDWLGEVFVAVVILPAIVVPGQCNKSAALLAKVPPASTAVAVRQSSQARKDKQKQHQKRLAIITNLFLWKPQVTSCERILQLGAQSIDGTSRLILCQR